MSQRRTVEHGGFTRMAVVRLAITVEVQTITVAGLGDLLNLPSLAGKQAGGRLITGILWHAPAPGPDRGVCDLCDGPCQPDHLVREHVTRLAEQWAAAGGTDDDLWPLLEALADDFLGGASS